MNHKVKFWAHQTSVEQKPRIFVSRQHVFVSVAHYRARIMRRRFCVNIFWNVTHLAQVVQRLGYKRIQAKNLASKTYSNTRWYRHCAGIMYRCVRQVDVFDIIVWKRNVGSGFHWSRISEALSETLSYWMIYSMSTSSWGYPGVWL